MVKKSGLAVTLLLITSISFGQENFKWEKIGEIDKSKDEIYSLTKMFIAETWKSAQNVIQNDDKEGGVILVKGKSIQKFKFTGGIYTYIYNYSATFRIKEGRYKVNLEDVFCEDAYMGSGKAVTRLQPFDGDNCPETGTFKAPGLPKKKAIIMMGNFKKELQSLFDYYPDYLKNQLSEDDW